MAAQRKRAVLVPSVVVLICLFAALPAYPKGEVVELEQLSKLGIDLLKEPAPAPEISLPSLEGEEVSLSSLKGRFLLLHFWATWTPTALLDLFNLEKLQDKLEDKPFSVISIAVDAMGKGPVEDFIREYSTEVPVLLDPKSEALRRYSIRVVPTSILIDERGYVIGRAVGSRQWDVPSAVEAFKKVVKGPGHYGIINGALPVKPSERSR